MRARRLRLGVPSGLVTVVALLGLSAPAGGPAAATPDRAPRAVLAERLVGKRTELSRLAPRTLQPVGRRVMLPRNFDLFGVSPDGRRAVLAQWWEDALGTAAVRLLDVRALRVQPALRFGSGQVEQVAWADATHLVALVMQPASSAEPCCRYRLVPVDVATGVVGASIEVAAQVQLTQIEPYRDGFVALAVPGRAAGDPGIIGPARLLVASASSGARVADIGRILAGWEDPPDESGLGRFELPGLAVDPLAGVAYAVGGDGLVARVDLATGGVEYHQPGAATSPLRRLDAWLQPPAAAKGGIGSDRRAGWLGSGKLLVSGSDEHDTLEGGVTRFQSTGYGLHAIDVDGWQDRTFGAGLGWVVVDGGVVLGMTSDYSRAAARPGVLAFAADGRRLYTALAGRTVDEVVALGPRVFVVTGRFPHQQRWLLDAATGRVLQHDAGGWRYLIPLP